MFLDEWSNRSKKMLLNLLDYLAIGCVFGIMACMFLVTDGKYSINIYRLFGNIFGVALFIILAISAILRSTLDTPDDWKARKEMYDSRAEYKRMKMKEKEMNKPSQGEPS